MRPSATTSPPSSTTATAIFQPLATAWSCAAAIRTWACARLSGMSLALGEVLCDLPDMAVGVGESRGAHPPLPVDRAVEQLDAAVRQLSDDRVRILDPDRELGARPCVGAADRLGRDQLVRRGRREQVDDRVLELEHRRVLVLEDHGHVESLLVERFRPLRILDEQGDRADALQRLAHFALLSLA